MATHMFNEAKRAIAAGEIDLNDAGTTIKVRLCMSNTTADTDNDTIVNVSDIGTMDTCDSVGYADATLGTKTVTTDDANDRAIFDAVDSTWAALAACTRTVIGALVYKFVTSDAASTPIAWVEFASPVTPDGSDLTIQWSATGILTLA